MTASPDLEAYRARTAAGGCRNFRCREPGRPQSAVWWKCPAGHREEFLYCATHGPQHLNIAATGALIECPEHRMLMTPLVEGVPL